ncbi:nitrate reductase [uncultured Maritalea sp.]|uniref:nitrate reductase n=1 Tax=uncultured Maritalea sp. TaxID=757249 RepID=UPI00261F00DA|nr:nitrate reductase [uncultured Maritalea sp.]
MGDTPPIRTTCPYCGVGCGVLATPRSDGNVTIKGDPDHPANFGRLCSKGMALGETLGLDGRLLYPEVNGQKTSWDQALDHVAQRFKRTIETYGPDSVGFYLSGQMLTEDYYVANKLMKGFIGSANVDTNSRLCMSSTVAGHKRAFGSDTVPGNYEDLEHADLIVLVGSNMAWCHPVLFQRILAAKDKRPGLNIVVIDPRRTKTAEMANLHLPINADGDVALFNGLLQHIVQTQMVNSSYVGDHTVGFSEAVNATQISQKDLIKRTGLSEGQINEFYSLFVNTEKVVTCFSQGVNQSSSGTDKVNAIINCHLATGRIGRKGMGPFSLTGQPNAMGGREVGGLANMLAAHMDIDNQAHRDLVTEFWGASNLAPKPGLKAVELFRALKSGDVKALWIMGTNPMVSMPDTDLVAEALAACPMLVVSDMMANTPTMGFAQVKLPSIGWGEKGGTVTNSERRISRQRAFLPAPGMARPDWWQMAQLGKKLGHEEAFGFKNAAEVFAEHAALSGYQNDGTRDFDIGVHADVSSEEYEALKPFQWPQPKEAEPSATRFFANGSFYTDDKRGRFVPTRLADKQQHKPKSKFVLNTGRVRDHWHTMTRTGKSATLSSHMGEPYCEISRADAQRLHIKPADLVRLFVKDQQVIVRALISTKLSAGQVFCPMHWNNNYASIGSINQLVKAELDPHSGQPALKAARVKVERANMSIFGFAVTRNEPKDLSADYWAKAITRTGWRIEFAHQRARDLPRLVREIANTDVTTADVAYHAPHDDQQRLAWFDGVHLRTAIYIASSPVEVSRSWAAGQLDTIFDETALRYRMVAGRPGKDMPDPGPIVCSCFSVGANQILDAVNAGCTSVSEIGKTLSAGTNCGSCKAEISELIHERSLLAAE